MKKTTLFLLTLTFCFTQGNISGYAIFDYENTTGHDYFDIERAYLSYSTDISDDLFFKIRLDVGRDKDVIQVIEPATPTGVDIDITMDQKLSAYIKNAYVDWKCEQGGTMSIGLIGTNSYGVQEKNWGYRFVDKSVLDKYKMTNTADFGIGYSHKIGNYNISAQLLNGEGFKKEENDDQYQQAVYVSLVYGETSLNKNEGYNVGLVINYHTDGQDNGDYHIDTNSDGVDDAYQDQNGANPTARFYDSKLIGLFGGWAKDKLRVGAEFNQFSMGEIHTFTTLDPASNPIHIKRTLEEVTYAVYANYLIKENWDVFARYDINDQNTKNSDINIDGILNSDDLRKDEQFLVGAVWNPTKGFYISPNINFKDENQKRPSNTYRLTFMFKY